MRGNFPEQNRLCATWATSRDSRGACWLCSLIIIGDTVTQVLSHWDGEPVTQTTRRLVIVGVAIVFVLPLALVKNMAKLAKTSALSITAVVWIVGVVFVRSFTGVTDDVPVPTTDAETELKVFNDNFFPAIGAISFAFTCHHSTFIVFNSLEVRYGVWRRANRCPCAPLTRFAWVGRAEQH